MTPAEFLSLVWPEMGHGYYCVANPHKHYYLHHVTKGQKAALEHIENTLNNTNAFFAVFTLQDEKVYNEKLDKSQVRTQVNSAEARVFFFDLDVDAELDDAKHYPTQAAAIADIKRLTLDAGLPSPMLVNSGGGVHVYWRLTRSIPAEEWRPIATKLRRVAQHLSIRLDPTRTTDTASVLRVVGTMNVKPNREPREVKLWTTGEVVTPGEFEERLDDAIKTLKVPEKKTRSIAGKSGNMQSVYDGLTPTFKQLVGACKQFQRPEVLTGGNLSQGEWYALLGVVRCVENGRQNAHLISCRHPDYTEEETDKKFDQLEQNTTGSTTCEKLELECANGVCKRCPFHGKVNSPIGAVFKQLKAEDTQVEVTTPQGVVTVEVPVPQGFRRLPEGHGVMMVVMTKEGEEKEFPILVDYDLYPVALFTGNALAPATSLWKAHLPRGEVAEIAIENQKFYDPKGTASVLANGGVITRPVNVPHVVEYMVAYIQQLQKMIDSEKRFDHLGWTADGSAFILPNKALSVDGRVRPVSLTQDVIEQVTIQTRMGQTGTLDDQVKLLRFYNHPNYIPFQFMICCSLGSPFFFSTGLAGAIVGLYGESGATKSTVLQAAASIWGDPKGYIIDGNPGRSSAKGRDKSVQTLSNLPVLLDEVTNTLPEQAKALALEVSQNRQRMVLKQDGSYRKVAENQKSALLLTTSNASIYSLLAKDNSGGTAGSMRVVEIGVTKKILVHSKPVGTRFELDLAKNFGWIGPAFMEWAVPNRDKIAQEIVDEDNRIYTEGGLDNAERFWSGVGGTAITICRHAAARGLLSFDADAMRAWFIECIHRMRSTVKDEHSLLDPAEALLSFVHTHLNKTLITHRLENRVECAATDVKPGVALYAHWDKTTRLLHINQAPFREYLRTNGLNCREVLEQLREMGSFIRDGKATLGRGTDYGVGQTRVFTFRMDVAGLADVDVETADEGKVVQFKKKGNI